MSRKIPSSAHPAQPHTTKATAGKTSKSHGPVTDSKTKKHPEPAAKPTPSRSPASPPRPAAKAPATKPTPAAPIAAPTGRPAPEDASQKLAWDVLARAEADIAAAVESLNRQMSAAMATITELAISQRGPAEAVVRTAPLDRATATFQRLVAEVVDEHLCEMLPPLVTMRNELIQCQTAGGATSDFCGHAVEVLDQVLANAQVRRYDPRPGETFDPLIHLAVGEVQRQDLPDGAVAEVLQPGFRSARGKVLVAAKVKVNRKG